MICIFLRSGILEIQQKNFIETELQEKDQTKGLFACMELKS